MNLHTKVVADAPVLISLWLVTTSSQAGGGGTGANGFIGDSSIASNLPRLLNDPEFLDDPDSLLV